MNLIKIYFDEDAMDTDLVSALRARGVIVLTPLEADRIRKSDEDQLAFAAEHDFVLYTCIVVLDRWHNAQIGASVARFVERIGRSDRTIMIGTPFYRRKYENKDAGTGYVVAAEVDYDQ